MTFIKGNQINKGRTPWNKGLKEIHLSPESEFKKGITPWNKGKHYWNGTGFKKGNIPAHKGKKLAKITGEKHYNWKGGRVFFQGYVLIYNPEHPFCGKYKHVREHRLIVEKQIGRFLLPKEEVHHLGSRDDNRPHMLMAFTTDKAHKRFEHNPDNVKPEEIIFDGRKLL